MRPSNSAKAVTLLRPSIVEACRLRTAHSILKRRTMQTCTVPDFHALSRAMGGAVDLFPLQSGVWRPKRDRGSSLSIARHR